MKKKVKMPVLQLENNTITKLRMDMCNMAIRVCKQDCDNCMLGELNIKEFKAELEKTFLIC